MKPGSTPQRIADLAAMDGGWLSIDALALEISDRFGPVRRDTVAAAVRRLRAAGAVEHRIRPHPTHGAARLVEIRARR